MKHIMKIPGTAEMNMSPPQNGECLHWKQPYSQLAQQCSQELVNFSVLELKSLLCLALLTLGQKWAPYSLLSYLSVVSSNPHCSATSVGRIILDQPILPI